MIQDLIRQGYQYPPSVTNPQAMLANLREQLPTLNTAASIDLLIAVGMFLTGFDAPTLNTLRPCKPSRFLAIAPFKITVPLTTVIRQREWDGVKCNPA